MEGLGKRDNDGLRAGDIAGALDWWREAGVDLDFADEAHGWLAAPAPPDAPPGPPPGYFAPVGKTPEPVAEPARIGGAAAGLPQDLPAFRQWWLEEPALDDGLVRGRVPPRGEAGAALMIVVGQPDSEDGEELLSGTQGRLLNAMLAAMGIGARDIYLASALPRTMPVPDWPNLAHRGLGAVLRHHIGLVGPKRLVVFGEGVLSLLGHDPAQNAQNSSEFYHEGKTIALLGARDLTLLARPAWKARFWREWLDWTGTGTE
ncbi:MAG TPA: hypothetical protein VN627_01070 [Novosphingobium sp.]|nr:hypothetical protein [Novosphingobium sp.]